MSYREPCKKCAKAGYDPDGETCAYCGADLSVRHEHDHFPMPKRHGGTQVMPVCLNCHDLKDRMNFNNWDFITAWNAIKDAPPEVKILYGKVCAMFWDVRQREIDLKKRDA